MSNEITPILMPKWGLSMKEGLLATWHVKEGDKISQGDEIMDVETDKIANIVEAADNGIIRRIVGEEDVTYPVQALLAVMAPESVSDAEVDAYIESFEAPEFEEEEEDTGPSYLFADLSVGRIRYAERQGEGTPVLLIHGFGGDLDNWLFNIDNLAQNRPTYALDLPGHGQSVKASTSPNLALLTATIIEFLDFLKVDKVNLIGHSMGGLVAAQVAIESPTSVASLGLICSAGLGADINADYIDGFTAAANRRELKPVLLNLFADASLVNRSMVEDLLMYKRLDGVLAFLTGLSAALFSGGQQTVNLVEGINALSIPVLAIAGSEDAIIPARHCESLSKADCHVLEGAGHMAQMEKAGQVNELLIANINAT